MSAPEHWSDMPFDSPEARKAYRRGAQDAYDSAMIGMEPRQARMIEEWLSDLAAWEGGDPPPPPAAWEADA